LTGFQSFAYSAEVVRGDEESVLISQHEMQRTPLYYFAFTYRFSYGEGRPQAFVRAREDLQS
jgi:hypothetical protein